MEALVALGVASNVVQFVDFSLKFAKARRKAYASGMGMTAEVYEIRQRTKKLEALLAELTDQHQRPLTEDEKALVELTEDCTALAQKLLERTDSLQAKDPKSKFAIARATLRAVRQKGDLEELESRLSRSRQLVLERIMMMMSQRQKSTWMSVEKAISSQAARDSDIMAELRAMRDEIVKAAELASSPPNERPRQGNSPHLETSLDTLHILLEKMTIAAGTSAKEDNILKRLRFDELHHRELAIPDAKSNTFVWLLDKSVPLLDRTQDEARRLFINWLRDGGGVFYISGNPGSGKSTLMKLLCQNETTAKELSVWAGSKELVFAQFFFWISGTELQRSLEGLYRGILWEILRACPELAKVAFPDEYSHDLSPWARRLQEDPFPFSEIEKAFERLVQSQAVLEGHKICLFIDGLDEYQGDYWKMAKLLKDWSRSLSIKICVACRPHNEFEKAFGEKQRLRLHELTRDDMKLYITTELLQDDRFELAKTTEGYSQLVDELIYRAEGIFLWLELAVGELLDGIGNSYSLSQLRSKLATVPDAIEEIYQRMLDAIPKSDRRLAAQTLLVLQIKEKDCPRTIRCPLIHSFVDDISDCDYDDQELYSARFRPRLDDEALMKRAVAMTERASKRCRGLITTQGKPNGKALPTRTGLSFSFPHRTVTEFLSQASTDSLLRSYAGEFDPRLSTILGLLRAMRSVYHGPEILNHVWIDIATLAANGMERSRDDSYVRAVETFEEVIESTQLTLIGGEGYCGISFFQRVPFTWGLTGDPPWKVPIRLNLFNYLALMGANEFVLKKLAAGADSALPTSNPKLLLAACIADLRFGPSRQRARKLVPHMLRHGLNPNSDLEPGILYAGTREGLSPPLLGWTVWTTFLVYCFFCEPLGTSKNRGYISDVFEIFQDFLSSGADPTICLLGYGNRESALLCISLAEMVYRHNPPNKNAILALLETQVQSQETAVPKYSGVGAIGSDEFFPLAAVPWEKCQSLDWTFTYDDDLRLDLYL